MTPACLLISGEDILNSNVIKLNNIISIVEESLRNFGDGKTTKQIKNSQIFNAQNQERINCMIATLPPYHVCGMKWVSVFPDNPCKFGLQNATSIAVLSDTENGFPLAFFDFSLCTALRTAAINAIAARELAKKNSQSIGIIGAGAQAIVNFISIKNVCQDIKKCYISSRTKDSEKKFIAIMKKKFPEMAFIPCESIHKNAVKSSDILISATSAQMPLIQGEWIPDGMLYCHIAGYEDAYSVAKRADKIICDSWDAVKHREQTISRMYKEGLLSDDNIYADLYNILLGEKIGREHEKEFIYFNSVGLPYLDISIAKHLYDELKNKKDIKSFSLCNNQLLNDNAIEKILWDN